MKCAHQFIITAAWLSSLTMAVGQPQSNYNLKKVKVHLADGRVLKGAILDIHADSLSMRVRSQYSLAPWTVGNKVSFRLRGVPLEYKAKVEAVSETTVSVRLITAPDEVYVVSFQKIDSVSVLEGVQQSPKKNRKGIAIHQKQIKSIHLRRKGSGLLGGLAGFGAALIGMAITIENHEPEGFMDLAPAGTEAFLLLPVIGVGIGTIGRTYDINGDKQAYEAFAGRILKKGNKKRGDKPPL